MKTPPTKFAVWKLFLNALRREGFVVQSDFIRLREELYQDYMDAYLIMEVDPHVFVEIMIEDLRDSGLFQAPGRALDSVIYQANGSDIQKM